MKLALALVIALLQPPMATAACPSPGDLEDELICPTCKTTLDQSDAPAARQMKALIARRSAQCASKQEIKDELVEQFGPAVLAAPPREGFHWLAWVLPPAGLLVAAGVIAVLVWRWSRRPRPDAVAASNGNLPLDPELERRLDRELARYDD
jgi:cytochrome c-type biogenesis protein CcmH